MTNLIGISGWIGSGKDTLATMLRMIVNKEPFDFFINRSQMSYNHLMLYNHLSDWEIKKFATPLKQIACILIGCTMKQLEDQDFKKSNLPKEWDKLYYPAHLGGGLYKGDPDEIHSIKSYERKPTTVREFLQTLGTEAIRGQIHSNAWINAMFSNYKYGIIDEGGFASVSRQQDPRMYNSKWIITDVRFPNELKAIKNRKGLLIRINRSTISSENFKIAQARHTSETALDNYREWDITVYNDGTLEDLYETAKELVNTYKLT